MLAMNYRGPLRVRIDWLFGAGRVVHSTVIDVVEALWLTVFTFSLFQEIE